MLQDNTPFVPRDRYIFSVEPKFRPRGRARKRHFLSAIKGSERPWLKGAWKGLVLRTTVLHILELDTVNVGLTMAHCYSDLSRLPTKVEQGGCEGMFEPPATGRQRVRGSGDQRMGAKWCNIFNGGCLGWSTARCIVSVRHPVHCILPRFSTLFSHLLSFIPPYPFIPSHVAYVNVMLRESTPEKSRVTNVYDDSAWNTQNAHRGYFHVQHLY